MSERRREIEPLTNEKIDELEEKAFAIYGLIHHLVESIRDLEDSSRAAVERAGFDYDKGRWSPQTDKFERLSDTLPTPEEVLALISDRPA